MKLRAALVLAFLSAAAVSRAATITYDLTAPPPGGIRVGKYSPAPSGIPGDQSFAPLLPGSSLTLEFDANGDGVSGDVTIASSQFLTHETVELGVATIVIDTEGRLAAGAGAFGTIPIDGLPSPALVWNTVPSFSMHTAATCSDSGSGFCDALGIPPGSVVHSGTVFPGSPGLLSPVEIYLPVVTQKERPGSARSRYCCSPRVARVSWRSGSGLVRRARRRVPRRVGSCRVAQ